MEEDKQGKTKKTFRDYFNHPGHTFVFGVLITIIVGWFFFHLSQKSRNLVYTINPTRTQIVKAGETSKLKVKYDSVEIHSDLYAIHIALWNDGKLPIKKENILHPIIIKVDSEINILESSFTTISRSVTNLHIDGVSANSIKIDWKILENGDGGVLQIIYEGRVNAQFKVEGIIEGQNRISEAEQSKDDSVGSLFKSILIAVVFLIIAIFEIKNIDEFKRLARSNKKIFFLLILINLLIVGMFIILIFELVNFFQINSPPFPF